MYVEVKDLIIFFSKLCEVVKRVLHFVGVGIKIFKIMWEEERATSLYKMKIDRWNRKIELSVSSKYSENLISFANLGYSLAETDWNNVWVRKTRQTSWQGEEG